MLKVCYLVSEYPAISHTFIHREIVSLREQGLNVKTASIRYPEHLEKMTDAEKEETKKTFYIKTTPFLKIIAYNLLLFTSSPFAYFKILREAIKLLFTGPKNPIKAAGYFLEAAMLLWWMKKEELRHVHVHFANPAATVALLASKFGSISYSLSIHGPDVFYNVEANLLSEKIKNALFVRSISHFCSSQIMKLVPYKFWDKIHIVRCGVDPHVFMPPERQKNRIPHIICVGRLVSAKGQHILLEAAKLLYEDNIPFRLTFVGGGDDMTSLKELCKKFNLDDYVTFTGPLGQDQVKKLYDETDIFALPSFAEGVPVVLMEAMSKEIPVISTHITGIPELIENGVNGFLTTPSHALELKEKCRLLINNEALRKELGKNGRKKILEAYNLQKNNVLMAGLFRKYL